MLALLNYIFRKTSYHKIQIVIRNSRCIQNMHKSGVEQQYLDYKRLEILYLQNCIAFAWAVSFKTINRLWIDYYCMNETFFFSIKFTRQIKFSKIYLSFHMWNELTFLWNELTILWNDLTMERSDRISFQYFPVTGQTWINVHSVPLIRKVSGIVYYNFLMSFPR